MSEVQSGGPIPGHMGRRMMAEICCRMMRTEGCSKLIGSSDVVRTQQPGGPAFAVRLPRPVHQDGLADPGVNQHRRRQHSCGVPVSTSIMKTVKITLLYAQDVNQLLGVHGVIFLMKITNHPINVLDRQPCVRYGHEAGLGRQVTTGCSCVPGELRPPYSYDGSFIFYLLLSHFFSRCGSPLTIASYLLCLSFEWTVLVHLVNPRILPYSMVSLSTISALSWAMYSTFFPCAYL